MFKPVSIVTREKRKKTIEKLKTMTLVAVFALLAGFAVGYKAQESLQTKYHVVPVAQAAPQTTPSK